jgi:small basic protein (TIGR04137 family)
MSIHKSLNLGGGIITKRSVWTRRERIEKLLQEGRMADGERPTGLPKVRTNYKVLTRKQMKAKEAEAATAAAEVAAAEAATGEGEAGGEPAAEA